MARSSATKSMKLTRLLRSWTFSPSSLDIRLSSQKPIENMPKSTTKPKFLKKIPYEKEIGAEVIHALPIDFETAINSDEIVHKVWSSISPLARNEWICWVTSAKLAKTRTHRILVGLDKMHRGDGRPCCWSGCPHR